MIKVAVTGAAGRMGSGIIKKVTEQEDMEVVAAIEMPNTPLAGKDAGIQAGIGELGVEITGSENLEETLKSAKPDVWLILPLLLLQLKQSKLPLPVELILL